MAYRDFKDLARRTVSDNILRNKTFSIATNPKYDGYQRGLAFMVYTFFEKKYSSSGVNNEIKQNERLTEELHKPIIRELKRRKLYSSLRDNIWDVDSADMELAIKFNKAITLLLCVIDILSKYAWVAPLKDKKDVTIVNAFQKVLDKSDSKPNKIWVDKGSELYNSSFKKWLKDNDIEMYSTHNEGKSFAVERFIKTLKSKIYKYMISISQNVYIDRVNDIVNKYKNISWKN